MIGMGAQTDADKALVERLNKLTEKHGEKNRLAKGIGVSLQMISNITTGRCRPSLQTLVAIADYYTLTVDYLLGRDGAKATPEAIQRAEARGYAMGLRLAADAGIDLGERLRNKAESIEPKRY